MKRINAAETITTSVLTLLEVERALVRAERQDLLSAGECQRVRGMFARASRSWMLMELSEEVRTGAGRIFPVEPVRTLDALHLATALLWTQAFPDLRMLTFDQHIDTNSRALGIA
jgi:hypothetical protein